MRSSVAGGTAASKTQSNASGWVSLAASAKRTRFIGSSTS
jgi:hypothetical protein